MYDELVKRLRDAEKMSEALAVLLPLSTGNETAKLYNEAADAIEELSVVVRAQRAVLDKFPRWIPVTERLPEDGQIVLCYWYNIHCAKRDNYTVMRFRKGRTAEELVGVKSYNSSDQWGNNLRPYCWDDPHGPLSLFGQEVTHWMPLPEPPKEG